MPQHILIIQGHPDSSQPHLCHALADAYTQGAEAAGHSVTVVTPARLALPLLSSAAQWQHGPVPAGVQTVQQEITRAGHLALFFPLWLGEMPAMLKGFLEQVARPGFAIDPAARHPFDAGLLSGRSARVVISMGMPATVYRVFYGAHSLKCLRRNILGYVGIAPVRATLVGGVAQIDSKRMTRLQARLRRLGAAAR